MATVRENIIDAFENALKGLDLGPETGNVETVLQDWIAPEQLPEMPAIYLLDPEEPNIKTGDEGAPMGTYDKTMSVHTIAVFVAGNETRDESQARTARRVLGRIEDKIYNEARPGTGSIKLVPGVVWIKERSNQSIPFGEGSNVMQVDIEWAVKYRHLDLDTTAAG